MAWQQSVKAAEVLEPPASLARISTRRDEQSEQPLRRMKLHHHLDMDMSNQQCASPSPPADSEYDVSHVEVTDSEQPFLVDALIGETVSEMLLGKGLLL